MNCPLKLVKLDQQELPEKPSDKPTGSLEIDGCLFSAADGDLVVTGSTTATLDDPTFASGGSHMFLVIETSLDDYKRIVLVANTESSDVGAICQNTAGEWNNCDLDETWNIVMPLDGDVDTYPAHWMLHYQLNQTSDPKLRSPMLHMVNNIGDLLSWRCEMNLPLTDVFYTGRLSNSVDKQVVKEHEIAEKVVETKALPSPNSSEDDAAVLKNDTPANLDAQKPALKELQSAATLSDKAKSGFNFGDSTFSELPKAGFNFAPKTEAPKAGFNFGASTATPAIPQSGFSFNASKAQEMPQSGFGFGAAKALDIPKPVFSFAVSKDSKAEVAPPTIPTVQKLQLGSQIINPIVKSAEVISSATKIPMAGVGVPNTPDKGIILTKTGLVKSNTPEKSATSKLAKDVLPESKASSRTPKKGANQSKPLSTKKQILKPAEDEGSVLIM